MKLIPISLLYVCVFIFHSSLFASAGAFSQLWSFEGKKDFEYEYFNKATEKIVKASGTRLCFSFPLGYQAEKDNERIARNLYPAVEVFPQRLAGLFFHQQPHSLTSLCEATCRLKQAGYCCIVENGSCVLSVPDTETLEKLWSLLVQTYKDLPGLTFKESDDDSLTDLDFIKLYIDNDIVISRKTEFLHDHMAHAMPIIFSACLNPNAYCRFKKQVANYYKNVLEMLSHAHELMPSLCDDLFEKIAATYSMLLDEVKSQSFISDEGEDSDFDKMIENVWASASNPENYRGDYWEKRFKKRFSKEEHEELNKAITGLRNLWVTKQFFFSNE